MPTPTSKPVTTEMVPLAVAAESYSISKKTLRRRISEGQLPAYRLGPRQVRVKLSDVEALCTRIPAAR